MGKFGKKNEIKVDLLSYNIALLGEPKIGKTTLMKEVCEKIGGEDSYIFWEMAHEAGADAISGIVYEDCDDWDYIIEMLEDIEDNKTTDYPNLRAIVIDTYDGWIQLAEEEAIRLWNSKNPDKRCDTIDASWNGFQKGQKKAFDLMFDVIVRLRKVGVATIIIGHVKNRDLTDVASGATYTTLTSDVEKVYFNLLKKKMHFIGLAYYDRTIKTEKTGKKNIVTHKEETINRLVDEKRKISFRDNNMAIDSGGRFADIVPEIPFDVDEFITALTDAIKKEQAKSGKSYAQAAAEQEAEEEKREEEIAKAEAERRAKKEYEENINRIITFVKENVKTKPDIIKNIMKMCKDMGYENPTLISKPEDVQAVIEYIESVE